jgi:hypothetical protein
VCERRKTEVQKRTLGFLLCLLLCFRAAEGAAQVVRVGKAAVRLGASVGGAVTVTAAPAFVSFQLIARGVATSSSGVGVTTTWTGISRLARLNLYGFFPAASAALAGGSPPVDIPSSAVLGQVPAGAPTSFTPFTQSNPAGGASAGLLLYCVPFLRGGTGSRTDILNMEIDLKGVPQLPAGTYTGTLYLQAQML